jgi:DsbC/DsbD-like thiol-disulfide interchange protein
MKVVALCLFLLLAPGGASAGGNDAVVEVRTFWGASAVHPGQAVRLAVVATIAPGYHINDHKPSLDYLIPTEINFAKTPSWNAEKEVYPRGNPRKFAFLDSSISVYEGETRIGAVLRAARSLRPGNYKLRGDFSYQACNDHACLPPAKVPFDIAIQVVPASVPVMPANSEVFKKINFQ